MRSYDLDLFRSLNDEYRERPLVPRPPGKSKASYEAVALGRVRTVRKHVEPAGKTVLELGTGRGFTAAQLVQEGARRVIAVDVRRYPDWPEHEHPDLSFVVGDLASEPLVESGSIDLVVSAAVFEHVERPIRMLESIYELLRPGGQAWLYFNLHRGAKASHRYREIHFPWPHLLFDDEQAATILQELGVRSTFAWVNRMTAAEYVSACAEIGFSIVDHRRNALDLTPYVPFYLRFEDKLGRYPALDLETDFLLLVLEKRRRSAPSPTLGYVERQRCFDALVEQTRAERGG